MGASSAGGSPKGPDQSKLSFRQQLSRFGSVYWIANWMELVERYAYYGVRTVLPVFIVTAIEDGGPQLDHIQKGTIYAVWAIMQSFVPILSGGFADRYGYKLNIAISTVLKIIGYLLMGYCVVLAESMAGQSLSEARAAGTDHAYGIFFGGAMFLALGTAIFKPGVQGLIANQMPKDSASLGWGIFYQMVNIGGFTGPLVAGYLRVLDWEYVFLACSFGIALNFIPLFFFKEPARPAQGPDEGPWVLLYRSIQGLLEPRLFFFTISFAGFWLMFYQLFDILPNFIDDWVDSRAVAASLAGILGEGAVPMVNGGNLTQEWIINFNALLISFFAFLMGYLTGLVRSLTAIVVGIAISAVAIYMLGMSMSGWWILIAIGVFSLGEMAASPTKMRYLAGIAPPGKEGLYMGYSNFTVGIGWSIGSIVAGGLYQTGGDKIELAKRFLIDNGKATSEALEAMPRSELLPFFEGVMGLDPWQTRELLWETYEPYSMWLIFTLIGAGSMAALVLYNYFVAKADAGKFDGWGISSRTWLIAFLAPITGLFVAFTWMALADGQKVLDNLGLILNGAFFALMLVVAILQPKATKS